ncbi:MAG TPA: putative oxidoreductase C-terminal domain-containing protein [Casimicrobiaceae bacterium]|nr:putative oxidoreductase C-terminal domain-containing protein [Casimicrobiaceae bacterium]
MRLAVLDPGHFHAALVQKRMYADVEPVVRVYAPQGPDLEDYLRRVEAFNGRAEDPTAWRTRVAAGEDFLDRFAADKAADVVVIAGNNRRKTEYVSCAVGAGVHTLADKPMAIDAAGFAALEVAFATARANGALLYDIMTERHEITTILQRELARIPALFGELDCGTADDPAVIKESVHYFAKKVSGLPLRRPGWFFDTAQQGEGLVDITTHLVDLVQWSCFPGLVLDYRNDVRVRAGKRWPTALTPEQFSGVTGLAAWPDYLRKDVAGDGNAQVYCNGRIDYMVHGVHARVSVVWTYEAPPGTGDTHYSLMRGTRASLVIRQGREQAFAPVLYLEAHATTARATWEAGVLAALPHVQERYPGVDLRGTPRGFEVLVPASYHVGHEAHFGQVADDFLRYVGARALPAWEVPNMLAKYYTTTQALALATR